MASSLVLFLFGHGVETSNLGDVSAQKLCQASGDFSLEQVGIDVSAPCTHDSNSIDVYTTTHARGSGKVQEDRWRSLCPVCGLLAMFRNRKWLFSDLPISVRKSTNIALQVLIMQSLLVEETRCWNGDYPRQTHLLRQCHMLWKKQKLLEQESSASVLYQSSLLLACMVTLFLYRKSKVFSGRRCSQYPRLSRP